MFKRSSTLNRYLAAFALAFSLIFGLAIPAHASSESTSDTSTFSWSAVLSNALGTTIVALPAVVFVALQNRKDN